MKVPLSWLQEYVPLQLPPHELAHRLTMAGLETLYVSGPSAIWGDGVTIGRVVELEPHPNADRLRLATVDLGNESLRVVCGAPNVAVDQRIAFARVGSKLKDSKTGEPVTLTAATIRGVVSEGMVCSERELGLGDDHNGILELPADAPVGQPLAIYLQDDVLDIDITANRGDCLSVLGVAREVGAVTGAKVSEPSLEYAQAGPETTSLISVVIEDPGLCSRYTASVVQGVTIKPSPAWMQRHLVQAGLRPINNVVDVTNYVMLEYGQPLHAFDLTQVRQATVVVRPARPGEHMQTLDGADQELQPPMLLITDPERAIGLAGIMGGANSEMTEATTDVLLESATFNAINTRRTASTLRLRTDASLRFEKGLNPELAIRALRRATALLLETAGGKAAQGISDTFPGEAPAAPIPLTHGRIRRVLGTDFSQEHVENVLSSLGFESTAEVGPGGEPALMVTPPYWRMDVSMEEDLIEEVARITGYDVVPDEPLAMAVADGVPESLRDLRERIKDLLVAAGLQETMSYSLVSAASLERSQTSSLGLPQPMRVANPMSREQEFLRTTLRGNVLRALSAGLRQTSGAASIFEAGRVYLPRPNELPEEREMVFAVMAGPRGESLWRRDEDYLDFQDAKGLITAAFNRLGVELTVERAEDPLLHPGRSAKLLANGTPVGVIGELHPLAREQYDIDVPVAACFELDLGLLSPAVASQERTYSPFSRYPAADRDLAVIVDEAVPAQRVRQILESHPLVTTAVLFDLYAGAPLPDGKKSLAYRLELQSADGTLSTEQVNDAVATVIEQLERETGAVLRT
jgi:phenylalanyl-tRNA synthetase beta chain